MKVYAVIEECGDCYYPDYTVIDNRVYLKREAAKKRLDELMKEGQYLEIDIECFEVEE